MSGMDGATIFFYEGETKTSWDAGQGKSKSVQAGLGPGKTKRTLEFHKTENSRNLFSNDISLVF